MTITPHKISQWFSGTQPEPFEAHALRAVVEKYPYFWPAGLLRLNSDDEDLDYDTAAALRALYVPAPIRVIAELASLPARGLADEGNLQSAALDEKADIESPATAPSIGTDSAIAHSLEHDPLENAVAATIGAEEGSTARNAAEIPDTEVLGVAMSREESPASSEHIPEPLFTSDYFSHQGVPVDQTLPDAQTLQSNNEEESDRDRGLMVMRSFTDWMTFFQRTAQAAQEEEESKRAVRAMWQKEKLAAALEEEEEEIPEEVFQMAVASISPDGVESESLAEVLAAQGKWERAVEMYRKLATKEPSKSAYFARKIEALESRHSDS